MLAAGWVAPPKIDVVWAPGAPKMELPVPPPVAPPKMLPVPVAVPVPDALLLGLLKIEGVPPVLAPNIWIRFNNSL